jgi:hypothetical protein
VTDRLALVAAFLLVACSSSAAPPVAGDAGPEAAVAPADAASTPDAGMATPDAASPDTAGADAVSSQDAPRAAGVRFVLRNEGTQTIYIQDNNFWTLSRNGQLLRANDTCEYCNCDATGGCAVCGRALDMTIAIAPGASHTWEWGGADWTLQPLVLPPMMLNLECEQPQAVAPGPLQVRITYSLSKVDEPPQSRIGPAINHQLDFQHPPTADVVLVAR